MKTRRIFSIAMVALGTGLMGCASTQTSQQTVDNQSQAQAADFQRSDARTRNYFDTAYAYAMFPTVTRGAVGVGAAYGKGEVYRNGKLIGHCSLTQGNVGAQLGGETFSEVIFFENKAAFDAFKGNEFALDADASAVAASAGAAASADYKKGVAVFTRAQGGLMFQAAIGGQKLNFTPDVETATDDQ